jgi:hypothetical protein
MEVENLAYLVDGEEVEVLQRTEHGVIIRRLYEGDHSGDPEVVGQVFDQPLRVRVEARIKELEARETQLEKVVFEKREELRRLEANKARFERLAPLSEALGRVCDFIEGKVTHYVTKSYGDYQIIQAAKGGGIPYYSDYGHAQGTKLLALFGSAEGNFSWGVNQYKDGSGHYIECVPFCGLEAAKAHLQDIINNYVATNDYHHAGLIKAGKEYGLEIPPALTQKVALKAITSARSAVEKAEKALEAARADLAATEEKWE